MTGGEGGTEEKTRKALEGVTITVLGADPSDIRGIIDDGEAENMTEAQDFKFTHNLVKLRPRKGVRSTIEFGLR